MSIKELEKDILRYIHTNVEVANCFNKQQLFNKLKELFGEESTTVAKRFFLQGYLGKNGYGLFYLTQKGLNLYYNNIYSKKSERKTKPINIYSILDEIKLYHENDFNEWLRRNKYVKKELLDE